LTLTSLQGRLCRVAQVGHGPPFTYHAVMSHIDFINFTAR